MKHQIMHQFTEGMYRGDAVSDHVLLIQKWLKEMGFVSHIYATKFETIFQDVVRPVQEYEPDAAEQCLVHHHAVGSVMAERLKNVHLPQVLVYHNITPPEFYKTSNPALSAQLLKGRRQLEDMRQRTILALADSPYNEKELLDLGYENTAVLPIVLQESNYKLPLDVTLSAKTKERRPSFLFVGRVAPNKKQEDLLNFLYCYQRLQSNARLILVGSLDNEAYVNWLQEYANSLRLKRDDVIFTGHVSQQELVTYYSSADLYISMSEHEGFGKPLIESMYHGLPILAFASTAVPYTLGDAGVLFNVKDFEALAEAADFILENEQFRERIIQQQNARVQSFLEQHVRKTWQKLLNQLPLRLS